MFTFFTPTLGRPPTHATPGAIKFSPPIPLRAIKISPQHTRKGWKKLSIFRKMSKFSGFSCEKLLKTSEFTSSSQNHSLNHQLHQSLVNPPAGIAFYDRFSHYAIVPFEQPDPTLFVIAVAWAEIFLKSPRQSRHAGAFHLLSAQLRTRSTLVRALSIENSPVKKRIKNRLPSLSRATFFGTTFSLQNCSHTTVGCRCRRTTGVWQIPSLWCARYAMEAP